MNLQLADRTNLPDAPDGTVGRCARCGEDHRDLDVHTFLRPVVDPDGEWRYWLTCPVTGDPILMAVGPVPEEQRS